MNKHIHRVIFSKARGQFVAVSETATSHTKGASGSTEGGGGIVRIAAIALAVGLLCSGAMAAPFGGQVVNGGATINGGGNLTTINQTTNRAIINWQGFGIGNGQTVQINQPGVNAALLNRVTGNLPTQIDGSLLANGKVFLINPNGIVVGANGLVNVNGGFVASTQNVGDSAFMAGGALNFSGAQGGEITVLGRIESASGPITLIAPKLTVAAGSALTAGPSINLVAASDVTLSNGTFNVTPHAGDAGELTSAGALQAAQVQLAAVNNNLGALAINTSGTIRATGVQNNADGSIRIVAIGQGTVELHDAGLTATNANGTGGKIDVTGTYTGLFGNTTLDASGTTAGGSIRVGGGFQGKESDIANAQATYVDQGVKLNADATAQGNGGRVVVWADGTTRYNGDLSAKGAGTGNGGDAEVSGKGTLAFNGTADLRGGEGAKTGTLLLDPSDITISNAANSTAFANPYDPAASSNLNIGTLTTALQTASVTVKTSGGSGGVGDITIANAIDLANSTANTTLNLQADHDINVNAAVTNSGAAAPGIFFLANRDVNFNANVSVGSVLAAAGRDINVNSAVQSGRTILAAAAVAPLTYFLSDSVGDLYTSNWQSGTGVIRFGGAGTVSSTELLVLNSGKDAGGNRTNLTMSTNVVGTATVILSSGFDTVNLDTNRSGRRLDIDAKTINISATTLGDQSNTLNAASFDASNNYVASGWHDQQGLINFINPSVAFTGVGELNLASGLAGTVRNDLQGSVQLAGPSGSHDQIALNGFRDVTINEALTATDPARLGINVTGRNISVAQSLTSLGSVLQLEAAAYDTGATVQNAYTTGGWRSQPGLLRFMNPATTTLTGGVNLYLTSGVDYAGNSFSANPGGPGAATSAGIEARVDLPANLSFATRPGDLTMPGGVSLEGFRDVTLPYQTIGGAYDVNARNITVPTAFTGIYAGRIAINAGAFTDLPGSPNFPGSPAMVSTQTATRDGSGNNEGTFNRPGDKTLDLGGRYIWLNSGIGAGGTHPNLNLGAITPGGTAGAAIGIHGFGTLTTMANAPISRLAFDNSFPGIVQLSASSIVVRSDITSYAVQLSAGSYNTTTGASTGSDANTGTLTFENNPVLRAGVNPQIGGGPGIGLAAGTDSGPLSSTGPGGVTFGYADPTSPTMPSFTVSGFNGTEILMENGQALHVNEIAPYTSIGYAPFFITQRPTASGDVVLLSDVTTNGNTFIGYSDGGIDAGGGGIRNGNHTITTPNSFYLIAGKDSAVNMAANVLSVAATGAGATLVVNEKDNVTVLDRIPSAAGNIEINARGEIDLPTDWTRTNDASLTFHADAQYGKTLAPGATTAVVADLNSIYTNTGVYGETGGDGLGAVTLRSAGPILITPVFRSVLVVEANTVAPAGLFDLNGVAIPVGTTLTRGQQVSYGTAGALPSFDFDTVTASGNPIRTATQAALGGFTVPAGGALQYYYSNVDALGAPLPLAQQYQPIPVGTFIPTATPVLVKEGAPIPTQLAGINATPWSGSGLQDYVVGGYQTAAASTVPNYTSLGAGTTSAHQTITTTGTAGALAGDTPVNAALAADYYGNPVAGTNTTLNLSGQFYTLNGTQTGPTTLNQLAAGTGNNSASGNGWDIGYGTGTLSTNTGDLRIYSGPAHATAGPSYAQGDAADLNIFTNPAATTFGNGVLVRDGAIKVSTGTGNLVVLGYRDVNVEPNGTLASQGNVTIGASRDLNINAPVPVDNAGKLTTLIAGNMITATQTIGTTGTGNLMLVAGGGVNVDTNVAVLSGSLQDSTPRTGVLAGGQTATGTFSVTNTGALVVGGPQTNNEVNDITFDGTRGIVYDATTPLTRAGIVSSTAVGSKAPAFGNIAVATSSGNLTIDQHVDSTTTGGTISLTGAQDVVFNALSTDSTKSTHAQTTGTVNVTAVGGSIVNASGLGGAGQEQVIGNVANLQAGTAIGGGIIDNTATGFNNVNDLNLNVLTLTAKASAGDAVLWNRGAVDMAGASGASGYFGINAGGLIQQNAAATLTAANAEFDTMRDTTIGVVDLRNRTALNIAGTNLSGGNYTATSESAGVAMTAGSTLNANGNVTLNGAPIDTSLGNVHAAGLVTLNGSVIGTLPGNSSALAIVGTTATVTAYGSGKDFDLHSVLSPAVLAQLTTLGVTDVVVNLGNKSTGYSVAQLTGNAILVNNTGNVVAGGWTVRTGPAAITTPATGVQQYNLTDTGGAVNLGAMNATVNAALGTGYATGSQASPIVAAVSTLNTASGFDTTKGSNVTLLNTTSSGVYSVKDANDVTIDSTASINASYIRGNNDVALIAGSTNNGNLTTSGALYAGSDLIGVAGNSVVLNGGTSITAANGNVTLVADETAGRAAGTGQFINNVPGLNIHANSGNVAIYAVAGGAVPAGYTQVPTQVAFNGLQANGVTLSEAQPFEQWNQSYQADTGGRSYVPGTGIGSAPHVRYKQVLAVAPPAPPATPGAAFEFAPTSLRIPRPLPAAPSILPTLQAAMWVQTPEDGGCAWADQYGRRYMPGEYGPESYFAVPTYLASSLNGREIEGGSAGPCNVVAKPYFPVVANPEITLEVVVARPGPGAIETHRVSIGADGLFRFDRSDMKDLLPEGKAKIERLANEIRSGFVSIVGIKVIGHADRLGTAAYNLPLSKKRADTVRALLMQNGLDGKLITTEGRGEAEPVMVCTGTEATAALTKCLQPNRRVTVDLTAQAGR
ncbi:filamentous hemagglutinin family protein [Variovorax sp. GrIS 2.14]|uniref:two-partner secretion domain-containing protein n=1 Tax=Variovorax sp. GrIS 2.14 TaxID=3071709 RepID=UPI0038F68732